MGWIDPVSSPSCGYCCSFAAYNVRVDFVDADITVFALGQSVVLVGSMLGLLYKLNRAYRSSYNAHQRPMQRLLLAANHRVSQVDQRSEPHADTAPKSDNTAPLLPRRTPSARHRRQQGLVLPAYYTYTQCAALLFIVEALLYLPASSTAVDWLRFVSFSACAFFDNFVVAFLCDPAAPISAWRAVIVSALLSGAYLLYVSLIPTSASCAWCGVHYPKPGIEYPYFVAASIYAAIAINTARASRNDETQVKAAPPKCRLRGRPAVVGWACTLTAAYGLASAGTFILDQWGSDAGYCLINVAILVYSIAYAPVLYYTFVLDTRSCAKAETLHVLQQLGGGGPTSEGATPHPQTTSPFPRTGQATEHLRALLADPSLSLISSDDLVVHHQVGSGGYGTVHLAEWHGATVAVKRLFLGNAPNEAGNSTVEGFVQEARVLGQLRHPNIVLLLGICIDVGHQAIVTEFVDGGSVFDYIKRCRRQRTENTLRTSRASEVPCLGAPLHVSHSILLQASRGMAYLHGRTPPIIHRDLKSANLLLDSSLSSVKVCDFGLSRCKEATAAMTAIGTCQWSAPEVLRRDAYSEKADVWSFGVIIWELCALELPFVDLPAIRVAAGVAFQGLRLVLPAGSPPELATIMDQCFNDEPQRRPSFAEIEKQLSALEV